MFCMISRKHFALFVMPKVCETCRKGSSPRGEYALGQDRFIIPGYESAGVP